MQQPETHNRRIIRQVLHRYQSEPGAAINSNTFGTVAQIIIREVRTTDQPAFFQELLRIFMAENNEDGLNREVSMLSAAIRCVSDSHQSGILLDNNVVCTEAIAKEAKGIPVLEFMWGMFNGKGHIKDKTRGQPEFYVSMFGHVAGECVHEFIKNVFTTRREFNSYAANTGIYTMENLVQTFGKLVYACQQVHWVIEAGFRAVATFQKHIDKANQERALAFGMVTHDRLGRDSVFGDMAPELIRYLHDNK